MTLAGLPFRKMNGIGNDFVILDLRGVKAAIDAVSARKIADRKTGVGCDQLITIENRGGPYMGVWNADGSEAGHCGNAARCVADILINETAKSPVRFTNPSGVTTAWRHEDGTISVDMGAPRLDWRDIPLAEETQDTRFVDVKMGPIDKPVLWGPSAVSMGNPHCVFFVADVDAYALDRFGPMLENHPMFPDRANVSLAQVLARDRIRARVWERGVGITKACGTAACAILVSAVRRRLTDRRAIVELDGGPLIIEWREDDHVIMTGAIEYEFDGVLPEGL
jgi:diaminopimelate epimerase